MRAVDASRPREVRRLPASLLLSFRTVISVHRPYEMIEKISRGHVHVVTLFARVLHRIGVH